VPHLEPEDLGLLALGEPTDPDQAAHLAACPGCSDELEQLRSTVRIGRVTGAEDRLQQPAPRVWTAIHDELGLGSMPRTLGPVGQAPPPSGASDSAPSPARVVPLAPRRPRLVLLGLAAAAAVALVAGLVLPRVLAPAPPQVLAAARLAPLPGWAGASGTAMLERRPDGHRALTVRLTTPQVGHDYRELWLIDPRTNALVSLGVVDGPDGTYAVPDDLDVGAYDLVDVSRERPDGNPAHSGKSILRGSLDS
jgi:hypothetical protein